METNRSSSVRLSPTQELKVAKPSTELYIGQVLKAVVVTNLASDEVMININGQHLNAKTPFHFMPGDLLEVKVVANNDSEMILELQKPHTSAQLLQSAFMHYLPIQAPASALLNHLSQLIKHPHLPAPILQQIRAIIVSILPVSQLPQFMAQAIMQSGAFLESFLFELKQINPNLLKNDFKHLNLKLQASLPGSNEQTNFYKYSPYNDMSQEHIPLPGAIPQPLQPPAVLDLSDMSPGDIQTLLKHQVTQVLARITSSQLNYLANEQQGYMIMLDLPIKTPDGIDVIPVMIKEHQAEIMQPAKWSFSFALHLKNLGDLQALVSLTGKELDITINASSANTIDKLKSSQEELSYIVSHLGLNLRHWYLNHGLEHDHIDASNIRLLDIKI